MKKAALLLVLSGVLTGFVVEQLNIFQQVEISCLNDSDAEQKDSSEAKKFGEDDKFNPEELNLYLQMLVFGSKYLKSSASEPDGYCSSGHTSILTPPPERV